MIIGSSIVFARDVGRKRRGIMTHPYEGLEDWLRKELEALEKFLAELESERIYGKSIDVAKFASYWFTSVAYYNVLNKISEEKEKIGESGYGDFDDPDNDESAE